MNPISNLVYRVLRFFVWSAIKIYYSRITIINQEKLQTDGPAIIATNHPNTLLDPFMAAIHAKKPVYFLANAGLFSNPISSWFFNTFYCIPIQRSIDKKGKKVDNKTAFGRCIAFFAKGGVLFIAPEGGSFLGRTLKKLKTGTARIGLSAEAEHNFQLGLTVIPVGLTYDNGPKFRSQVIINVGDPISYKDYQAQYETAQFETAKTLTKQLSEVLESLIISPPNEKLDTFVSKSITNVKRRFQIDGQRLIQFYQFIFKKLEDAENGKLDALVNNTTLYHQKLATLHIKEESVERAAGNSTRKRANWIFLILGFPLFIWGLIHNLLIFLPPYLTWKNINIYPSYESTVKVILGFFMAVIFYPIQYSIFKSYFGLFPALIYLITLIPAGLFAWYYAKRFEQITSDRRLKYLKKLDPNDHQFLINTWKKISTQFEDLFEEMNRT